MKTAKRLLMITAVGLLLAGAAPLVAAQVAYACSLHELGQPPPVPAQGQATPAARVFWIAAGERLPPNVERLVPWRYGWAIAYDRHHRHATHAAITQLARGRPFGPHPG